MAKLSPFLTRVCFSDGAKGLALHCSQVIFDEQALHKVTLIKVLEKVR